MWRLLEVYDTDDMYVHVYDVDFINKVFHCHLKTSAESERIPQLKHHDLSLWEHIKISLTYKWYIACVVLELWA